jgi:polyisoprenoid-binding protein YceI
VGWFHALMGSTPKPWVRSRRFVTAALIIGPLAALAAVYLLFFTPAAPAPLKLGNTAAISGGIVADPVGVWKVSGGQARYRVREKLARLPAPSDAVGATEALTGSMTVNRQSGGLVVSAMKVEADLSQLRSNEARRDKAIRTRGLETDLYPTATFVSSAPVEVPSEAEKGSKVKLKLDGDLTIHGTTKHVSIPVEASLAGGKVQVVGALKFPMSAFNITPPNFGGFVTVTPEGTMEFEISLVKL